MNTPPADGPADDDAPELTPMADGSRPPQVRISQIPEVAPIEEIEAVPELEPMKDSPPVPELEPMPDGPELEVEPIDEDAEVEPIPDDEDDILELKPLPPPPPPHVVLMQIVQGNMVAKALQASAELGLADLLKDGPRAVADLAAATSTHAPSLFRLLRALASRGIFREDEKGLFANTPLSEALRADAPMSARDYVMYATHDGNTLAWTRLMSVLRTGEPSFVAANGVDLWAYLKQHPELESRFNRAMTGLSAGPIALVLESCDFSPFKSVVDVGGGEGRLLAAILEKYPLARGVLFDLPAAAESARRMLESRGLAGRTEVVAGNIFESIPAGHDAYILKNVLHDWSDDKSLEILQRVRAAIPPHGRLFILDAVMTPGNDPHPAKWFDLHMMVALGGRERTADEFRALLERAGFTLAAAKPLPAPIGVVEAVPAPPKG